MESKNKTKEVKVYDKVYDYFFNLKDFVTDLVKGKKKIDVRKRGSDMTFKLTVGEHDTVYLEIIKTDINFGSGFTKSVQGVVTYKANGSCIDKKKVALPNKRQQTELTEMVDHIERCLRPNSINFILDD